MKKIIKAIVISLVLLSSGAQAAEEKNLISNEQDKKTYEWLKLFGQVFELIKSDYVDTVSDKELIESAINGMLEARDPHSSYLDDKSYKSINSQTSGSFGGIGITFVMDKGVAKIITPLEGTPADRAGIKAGDLITHINGVSGLSSDEAAETMRGKPGEKIKLTIYRESSKEMFDVVLRRENINLDSVKVEMKDNNIGYIRINSFTNKTYDELVDKLASLQNKNKKLAGYVIDLRNNPGGILCQASSVADVFLDRGEIYSTRDRKNETRVNATEGDITNEAPIVVIINEGSASAAEILAGALQDQKRAVVVGIKSFGKGSIQTVKAVSNTTAIRFTSARYYTPSGRSIQAEGIVPDIEIRQAKVEEFDAIDKYSEATLNRALKNDDGQTGDKKEKKAKTTLSAEDEKLEVGVMHKIKSAKPVIENGKNVDDKEESILKKDYQLLRAIDVLKGMMIYSQTKQEDNAIKYDKKSKIDKVKFVKKTKKGPDGCLI